MSYQREETARATPDSGDATICDLQMMLSESATTAIRDSKAPPPTFFLASVAAFLARLRNNSSIAIAHGGQIVRLDVDTALPFKDLLSQAARAMAATEPTEAKPDAYLQVTDRRLAAPADTATAFTIETTGSRWTLLLMTSEWTEEQATLNLGYLKRLIENAADNPLQPVATLRVIAETDALKLYRRLNKTAENLPQETTVLDLFARQVRAHRDATAVSFGEVALSYAQLDAESTALAAVLVARGADQSHPVAICVHRSERMPVLLLAVLKARSYYVPLDPSHPQQRLTDMLDECKPAVVIVSPGTRQLFADTELPLFDPLHDDASDGGRQSHGSLAGALPDDLSKTDRAYMIYTSGTTGRPKGVIITHGSLLNFLLAVRRCPGLVHGDRMLAVATLSFDMSVMDMFLPLITGATLVIASEQMARDPWQLAGAFEKQNINCMQATPATWRMLLSIGYAGHPDLKIHVGGEALSRDLANELNRIGREVWNLYGPTETTVYSSVLRVEPCAGPVLIGPPIANTVFYVADPAGQLLPPEFAGELYIGGEGVAVGYYERPELNRERFIPDPWTFREEGLSIPRSPRLFRTGDLVRLAISDKTTSGRADGYAFEFFGRIDHQVKLRGYRIELGEIESVLRTHPALADAAVVLREDEPGTPWLVAYVTLKDADIGANRKDLMELAAQRLPNYMLPSRLVTLAALPLTGSGKVDRRALAALPAPTDVEDEPKVSEEKSTETDKPLDALETTLLRIFREVLRLKSFGPDDNFFEHGGYSLLSIRLFVKIGAVLHTQLPITALFDAPTVRRLASMIRGGGALHALVPIRTQGNAAPFFIVHSYLLYGLIGRVVDEDRPIYGLRERLAVGERPNLDQCIADYLETIDEVWPQGPVHLGGWCAASTLTVELAGRLLVQGRQVGMVALFDAEAPGFVPTPPSGSRRLARLRAMWSFHRGRIQGLGWLQRLQYLWERLTQAPLNIAEHFYTKYDAHLEIWRRRFPWLPNALFYNQFTQIGQLQADRVEELDARIQLFRARDVTMIAGSDPGLGWGEVARRGVAVHYIPGHHESMFLEPNVEVLKEEFQASMRTVENELGANRAHRS